MMRKIRLLLAVSLFTVGSLNPVAADAAQPEDHNAFIRILSQLQLDEEEVDASFLTSRVVPSDESRTIWVIPTILAQEGGTPSELGCYVLLADTKKGRIISRCYYPQIWRSEAGYYELQKIGIDTLGYRLHSDGFTFGVRSSQRIASSRVSHYDENTVELFVCQGDSLQYVFGYNDLECKADERPDGAWVHVRTDQRLVPLAGISDGYYDFALLGGKKTLKNDLIDSMSIRTYPPRVFGYAENCYKEVEPSATGFFQVGNDDSGKNFRGNIYYFGRSMSEVYPLIRDERNEGGWEVLLPDLPGENTSYTVSYDDGNDRMENRLDVSYEYMTPEYLVLKIASPRNTVSSNSDQFETEFYILQQNQDYTMTGHATFTFTSTLINP